MKISIGILAWNEESSIAATIDSIFDQTLLRNPPVSCENIEIICVPNGCSDRTALVAREALNRGIDKVQRSRTTTIICELQEPSKGNAWNRFVHEFSDSEADYLVFVDGDVRISHPETLANMIDVLEEHREFHISGARTIKHIQSKRWKAVSDYISLGASAIRREIPGQFAGCLYCGRAAVLRRFFLPDVLVGEDSFVNAMVNTDFFTRPQGMGRIVTPANASVNFEAYTSVRDVLRNLRRRAVSITINGMLYAEFWANATEEQDAGRLMQSWQQQNPNWSSELVGRKIAERGWWIVPKSVMWKWIRRLGLFPWYKAIALSPVVVVATIAEAIACVAANRALRRGKTGQLWFATNSNKLVSEKTAGS